MRNMAISTGKLPPNEEIEDMNNNDETGIVTFEEKREVLRYVIYCAHHIDLLNRLHIDPDHFAKLANLKLEMCPPCLLHLESRVGENLFASLYQELIRRVYIYILY